MSFYADCLNRAIEVFGTKDRAEDWLEKMSAELEHDRVRLNQSDT